MKMLLKVLVLTSVILVCEGTIDRLLFRRPPLRFWLNNQSRRPNNNNNNWTYQVVNGRPVISGFPNPNAYVAFGLNPQTGQIEQTQVIAQTRPGGPVVNMIQNMLHVAGQFFGQLTGAFGNAVGGALQTAGQFGQDIQDITNPIHSITGIPQPLEQGQQPKNPFLPGILRPTAAPSAPSPTVSTTTQQTSTSSVETIPELAKSDIQIQTASRTIDHAIITLQTFQTNVQTAFATAFESEEGQQAKAKVMENIDKAMNKMQNFKEQAIVNDVSVLRAAQNTINEALDNIETALVSVASSRGTEFIEPTRNELNKAFTDAIQIYEQLSVKTTAPAAAAIPSQ